MSQHPSSNSQQWGWRRYTQSLWLLTTRDLKVRYSTSALGYLWSVLDPLAMSAIYWFVFTQVFQRPAGTQPYVVFLLTAMLPWVWFNNSLSDATKAFLQDEKLVRSIRIPRTIWVNRVVLSKAVEFVLSMPVLAFFAILSGASINASLALFPVAAMLQAALSVGLAMFIAPLVVLFRDLERAVKLVLRFMFYATPVIYGTTNLPLDLQPLAAFNPLTGIIGLYRAGFFPHEFSANNLIISVLMTAVILVSGLLFFRRMEPTVLKEI
ncbi:MAG TPA: ABC transporter permease [Microbacteriaceae bacterium]|nr:ABC transporter permease [Microbacteriaceae bacterium]